MILFIIIYLIGSILACLYWKLNRNSYRRYNWLEFNTKYQEDKSTYILCIITSWWSLFCIWSIFTDEMYHKYKSFKDPFREIE